jgi:hypothetical protein
VRPEIVAVALIYFDSKLLLSQGFMTIPKYFQWIVRGMLLLLVISLGANYLIQYALHAPPRQKTSKAGPKQPPANEAAFRSALEAGTQAFNDGRYTDALDRFLDAEHTASQLSDDQYDALKNARLQLATTYETAGDHSASDSVYRALVNCAISQARALNQSRQFDEAIPRTQDAIELVGHLKEGKDDSNRSAYYQQVISLQALKRYPEAIDAQRQLIEAIKSSAEGSDQQLVLPYSGLADLYANAQDWQGFRDTLLSMIELCDRVGPSERMMRNWAQYNLIIGYYRAGDTDTALSKADEFYNEYATQTAGGMRPVANVVYQPNQFASLALQIATESKMPDAMDSWKKKGGTLPGGISVIALHPYQEH